MIHDECPACRTSLVPTTPPEILKNDFPNEFFKCPTCNLHYRIPYKGEMIKIGPATAGPIFYSFSPIMAKSLFSLRQLRRPKAWFRLGRISAEN